MKNLLKITLLLIMSLSLLACNKDQVQQEVNESDVINGLIIAKSKIKKMNNLNSINKVGSVNNVNNTSEIDLTTLEQIKQVYIENLNIINVETGLNLTYDEREFNAMMSMVDQSSINNGFLIPNETVNQNLELIDQNGGQTIFNESQGILSTIYGVNTDSFNAVAKVNRARISWGCGIALASNFVATLGLGACVTGVGCPIAIAGKALALAGVATSC